MEGISLKFTPSDSEMSLRLSKYVSPMAGIS